MLARCGMSVFLVPHHSASLHVWPACALVHFSGWSALVVPARVGAAQCASCAPGPCATREVTQVCSNAQPWLGHPQCRPQLPGLFARLHSRRYCSFRRAFVFLRPNNSFNATVTCRADNPASLSGALTQTLGIDDYASAQTELLASWTSPVGYDCARAESSPKP